MTQRILVTGAAGQLGSVLRDQFAMHLEAHAGEQGPWHLRFSDRAEMPPLTEAERNAGHELAQCDLADAAAVNAAVAGVNAIVHLGGFSVEGDWPTLISANLQGVINIYEAARQHGVNRVLFASSNHAIGLYRRGHRLDHTSAPRPDSRYGVSKAFGEDLAYLYAHKHRVRSFCMRIGPCTPAPRNARMLSTWLSHGDFLRLLTTGLTASYRYEIVYGVSNNRDSWWDNRRAYALGYAPQDDAVTWPASATSQKTDNPITEAFQGGHFVAHEFEDDLNNVT